MLATLLGVLTISLAGPHTHTHTHTHTHSLSPVLLVMKGCVYVYVSMGLLVSFSVFWRACVYLLFLYI